MNNCANCGDPFERLARRGSPQIYCTPKCRDEARAKRPKFKAYKQGYFQRHRTRLAGYYADYRDAIKREAAAAYGGKCVDCGENDYVVLVLDHVENDGATRHSRWGKRLGGFKLYQMLRAAGWPREGLQLLCHNCNFRKEYQRRKDAVRIAQAS